MRAARVDGNQREIVQALREAGATVQHLHTVGKGCPDVLVGYRGANLLLELKDGSLPPSRQKLTADEEYWHTVWRGQVEIARSVEDALRIIGISE